MTPLRSVFRHCLLAVAALGASGLLAAHAGEAEIRKNLAAQIPQFAKIDEVRKTPVDGLYEVRINNTEIYYADEQGTYLLQGNLIDVQARKNLTEERVDKLSQVDFDKLPLKDAFKIVRGNGKRQLAVFEDPNCGYCKQFERDLKNVDNVTVHLFLYPVLGPDSTAKSRDIWCSKDKGKTWSDWMTAGTRPEAAAANCDATALQRNIEFGRKHNITGTPTLIFSDGTRAPGAIPSAQVEKQLTAAAAAAQAMSRARTAAAVPAAASPGVRYRVECADRNAHLFAVTLTIDDPAASQRVSLPVWIPGSYLVREFAKNLQNLRATQGRRPAAVTQLDKHSWTVDATPGKPLVLRYEVCAYDHSVRTAWLDADRGFFNGTSLCLRVEGRTDAPHALEIVAPPTPAGTARWSCATALAPQRCDAQGFGHHLAADYDELADSPVELGAFWSADFEACGVPHRFVVAGAPPSFDGARLIDDARAICETQMRFWHGAEVGKGRRRGAPRPPHDRYVFMLNAVDDGYGGLEHRHSTALICTRRDLPQAGAKKQPEGYTTLLGLISHEYFHTWNVKRLRPAEFARYDYDRENYTRLLWFFEGFTSYYDDLLLRRAGRIDDATYLKLLNKTANQVLQTPGRQVQSVADASFDAWVKYYRQDEQTPNQTVSYYTKGALVALCLDLTLRREGHGTLDDVMRHLWEHSGGGGPIDEAAIAGALEAVGARSYAEELARWVHGTGELPLSELLRAHGVATLDDPAVRAQELGLRVAEANGGVQVKVVLRGGAAERAGFAANDEWIGIEGPAAKGRPAQGWRLTKLDDLTLYLGAQKKVTALVARDRRLLRLPLTIPTGVATWRLFAHDATKLGAWLAPPA